MGDSHQEDLLSQAGSTILHPRPELWKLAPSTRELYALKWKLFTSWCGERLQDPVNCPVGTVLEFLQARFSTGLSHSTLKVYVAAISAYHAPLGGMSVGKDPFGGTFPPRFAEAEASVRPHVPTWDLAVSLLLACPKPFFTPEQGMSLRSLPLQPVVLQAFCPPPFREPDQQKHNCMCPVCALDAYVHRAALWRKSDQLFVCYGPPKKGHPATKQTLSRWIVDAISTAYESSDLPRRWGSRPLYPCYGCLQSPYVRCSNSGHL
ncbi:Thiazole synthase [Labeo rohita]|uniref:Thiazole synthase n=1 Tax=Labeo rohita TaxID=84645 RepID=A0ABQ8L5G9_LABRO|nr:Thiazole synthase [Labeo rohita]